MSSPQFGLVFTSRLTSTGLRPFLGGNAGDCGQFHELKDQFGNLGLGRGRL